MSKSGLDFSKLNPFTKLLGNDNKDKSIIRSVGEGLKLTDSDKSFNRQQPGNGKHELITLANLVNADEKEAPVEKSPIGFNNVKNKGESCQDYIKLASVANIYEKNNISEKMNTIFMAETYLKALPDYLPKEVKRKTVLDIINSSNLNTEKLLADGEERKKALNDFMQKFSQSTDKIIKEHEDEILRLSESILANERAIAERKNLQEEQVAIINYEVQRLQKIIKFLQGEDKSQYEK